MGSGQWAGKEWPYYMGRLHSGLRPPTSGLPPRLSRNLPSSIITQQFPSRRPATSPRSSGIILTPGATVWLDQQCSSRQRRFPPWRILTPTGFKPIAQVSTGAPWVAGQNNSSAERLASCTEKALPRPQRGKGVSAGSCSECCSGIIVGSCVKSLLVSLCMDWHGQEKVDQRQRPAGDSRAGREVLGASGGIRRIFIGA